MLSFVEAMLSLVEAMLKNVEAMLWVRFDIYVIMSNVIMSNLN